jgi:type VI secretion system protein ImpF
VTREEGGLERTAKPSLIDRLIDRSPGESADPPVSRETSIARYRASVSRDVEWLLNARRSTLPIPDGLEEVPRSVLAYGLPDLTSIATDTVDARSGLVRQIERALQLFEPRLGQVRVLATEMPDGQRRIRLTIDAMLEMDPEPERVVFDTVVELARGDFSVDETR